MILKICVFLLTISTIHGKLDDLQIKVLKEVLQNVADYQPSIILSQIKGDTIDSFGLQINQERKGEFEKFFKLFESANTENLDMNNPSLDKNGVLAYFLRNIEDKNLIPVYVWGTSKETIIVKTKCIDKGFVKYNVTYDIHRKKLTNVQIHRVTNMYTHMQNIIIEVAQYAYLSFDNEKDVLKYIKVTLDLLLPSHKWSVIEVNTFHIYRIFLHTSIEFSVKDMKLMVSGRLK